MEHTIRLLEISHGVIKSYDGRLQTAIKGAEIPYLVNKLADIIHVEGSHAAS